MRRYNVGKGLAYENYVLESLRVMYEAGMVYFSLRDLADWAGLPSSGNLRRICDRLVLEGRLSVAAPGMFAKKAGRTYNLNSVAWFNSLPYA